MKYVANRFHVRMHTIGANVVIIKDPRDLNNIRFLVVVFKALNSGELRANCGNYDDALMFAHSC